MKVLCKKDFKIHNKDHSFERNKYYEIRERNNVFCWLKCSDILASKFYYNRREKPDYTSEVINKRVFSDYFYTSQEIRQMKLIKLNEKITE
jgi:hypothetical protein